MTWSVPGCGGSADQRPPSWSFISATIIQPSCATADCHSKISQRSGVELDDVRVGYEQLLGRSFVIPPPAGTMVSDLANMAEPLLGLLRAQGTRRMPPDVPLPEADITLIASWIAGGAAWDGSGSAPSFPTPSAGPSADAGASPDAGP